jgi:hypothetical protein
MNEETRTTVAIAHTMLQEATFAEDVARGDVIIYFKRTSGEVLQITSIIKSKYKDHTGGDQYIVDGGLLLSAINNLTIETPKSSDLKPGYRAARGILNLDPELGVIQDMESTLLPDNHTVKARGVWLMDGERKTLFYESSAVADLQHELSEMMAAAESANNLYLAEKDRYRRIYQELLAAQEALEDIADGSGGNDYAGTSYQEIARYWHSRHDLLVGIAKDALDGVHKQAEVGEK